ncbi:putative reverse transcriptase domain-containing protein [Tanacetum coccineum]
MSGRRNTRNTNTSTNNEDQPNDLEGMVARQLNVVLPNLVTQSAEALNANRGNSGVKSANNNQGCSYKTFMSCNPKEFYGNEGAVGLLLWIEGIKSKLYVQTRGRKAALQLTWEEFKKLLLEEYCPISEVQKLESEFWNHDMVGSNIEKYTTRFHELAKLVPHMVTPEDKCIDHYIWGLSPKLRGWLLQQTQVPYKVQWATNDMLVLTCFECGSRDHLRNTCPKLNRALGQGWNRPNPGLAIEGNTKQRNNDNKTRRRAFIMGANEAVLEGHPFSIDLIPFGHGSFDVIMGMNWLSKFMAEITCHEKIVQIPLPNGEVLKVHGERPEGKLKYLTNMKTSERKLIDIPIVRDFLAVFPEDLLGLPLLRQVKFRIDLIPRATPVTKSPYR